MRKSVSPVDGKWLKLGECIERAFVRIFTDYMQQLIIAEQFAFNTVGHFIAQQKALVLSGVPAVTDEKKLLSRDF